MTEARRFTARGRVQGVGFRYFAIRAARTAGIVGTVRNLTDGTVEAIAEGSAAALAEFRAALERGPSGAYVSEVEEITLAPAGRYTGFDVVI